MKPDKTRKDDRRFETRAVHAGEDRVAEAARNGDGPEVFYPISTPIYASTTFAHPDVQTTDRVLGGEEPGYSYARYDNPTVAAFEKALAALEGSGGTRAFAFASGMAAMHAALTAAEPGPGATMLAADQLYGSTATLLMQIFGPLGVEVRFVDAYDLAARRRPDLAARLAPLRAEHVAHLAALGVTDLARRSPTPVPTDPAPSPPAPPLLPDDPARIAAMLGDAAASFDLVLTCGAVSAGEKDHIPALLQARGRVRFWKVRMKPGMPVLFGELGRAAFLGLPGNPVSVLANWLTLGRVLVDGLQGRREPRPRWHARLAAPFGKSHARREFVRGRLACTVDGRLEAVPNPATGSHRMRAAADSDALLVLPEGPQSLRAGDMVEVLPY